MSALADLAHLLGRMDLVDLSQPYLEDMPAQHGHSRYFHGLWDSFETGSIALSYQLVLNEHSGTHVDAPAHFVPTGHPAHRTIDEEPLDRFHGRALTFDVRERVGSEVVSAADLLHLEAALGVQIGKGDIVFLHFGWDQLWGPRSQGRDYVTSYPGLSRDGAELLVERGVSTVGSDTISIDPTGVADAPAHQVLLGSGVLIVENLTSLARVVGQSYAFIAPLKIGGGSGAPTRAFAFIEHLESA